MSQYEDYFDYKTEDSNTSDNSESSFILTLLDSLPIFGYFLNSKLGAETRSRVAKIEENLKDRFSKDTSKFLTKIRANSTIGSIFANLITDGLEAIFGKIIERLTLEEQLAIIISYK